MTAQQKSLNVLVIGDVCTDIYYLCKNTKLNPESSAPLVQVASTYHKKGMAANVNYCLGNLGITTRPLFSNSASTKTRYVNAKTNEQLLRIDFEDKVEPLDVTDLESTLYPHLYDAVVISDYNKGFLNYEIINLIASISKDIPVILDTKKNNLDYFDKRIFLKINEHEANSAVNVPNNAIVTLGAGGVIWYNNRWPAYKSDAVDVCGAGDAFLAGLVYGYLTDKANMIEYAIVNAGISVRHIGTYSPTLKELEKGLDDYYKQCRKN